MSRFTLTIIAALTLAATASATNAPVVIKATYTRGVATITFAGYGAVTDSYFVEVSRGPSTNPDGHFAVALNRSGTFALRYDGTQTWYLQRRLAPGAYYVRVFQDYTNTRLAAAYAYAAALSKILGGSPPVQDDGTRYLAWSSVTSFVVR